MEKWAVLILLGPDQSPLIPVLKSPRNQCGGSIKTPSVLVIYDHYRRISTSLGLVKRENVNAIQMSKNRSGHDEPGGAPDAYLKPASSIP
jgi:hypothetical protein